MKPEGKGGSQKKETIKIDLSKVEIEPLYEEMLNLLLVDDRIPAGAKLC